MLTEPRAIRYPIETPPGSGEATEIAEGILWLRFPLPMARTGNNLRIAGKVVPGELLAPDREIVWRLAS